MIVCEWDAITFFEKLLGRGHGTGVEHGPCNQEVVGSFTPVVRL